MDQLLCVQDLTVSYRSRDPEDVLALYDVRFEMRPGEAVGILGESGCGKTTLALTLMNVLPSSARILQGRVVFCDVNLLALPEKELQKLRGARIAMVHQEPGVVLNPVLRIGEQIGEVLRAHRATSHQRALEESKTLLSQVGFEYPGDISKAYPHQLSGGQQQRVAIAQAIACRPSLLIADEPTTSLDRDTQEDILALLRRLREEFALAIILISHDPGLLAGFTGRILVMYAGSVVEEGPSPQIMNRPMHPYTQALLRCWREGLLPERRRQILPIIEGDSPRLAHPPVGCSFRERCPDRMEICRSCTPGRFPADGALVTCFKYAS